MKEIFIILENIPYEGYDIINNVAYLKEEEAHQEADRLKSNKRSRTDYVVHEFIIKE